MTLIQRPDYLIIGHVALDQTSGGGRLGGTLAYAGLTAAALGMNVAGLTSADPTASLSALQELSLKIVPAEASTQFKVGFGASGRQLQLLNRAADLDGDQIPEAWHDAPIVHLAPIADEVDPQLARRFRRAFLVLTPQGWLRRWDAAGTVSRKPWKDVETILPSADLAVVSDEDIDFDQDWAERLAEMYRLFVLTRGARGAIVYVDGKRSEVTTKVMTEIDSTGAGDIFAAAFAIHYLKHRRPGRAALFAHRLAARSVTSVGLSGVPGSVQATAELDRLPA